MPLIRNKLKPLAKSLLISFALTAVESATYSDIQKEMLGSHVATLIISNQEMGDIMKIVKSLEESGLLIKDVSETTENEAKVQKGRFLSMLQWPLTPNLLGDWLTGKGTIARSQGCKANTPVYS